MPSDHHRIAIVGSREVKRTSIEVTICAEFRNKYIEKFIETVIRPQEVLIAMLVADT